MAKKVGDVVSILKNQKAFLEGERERIEKELQKLNNALDILDTGEETPKSKRGRKKAEQAL